MSNPSLLIQVFYDRTLLKLKVIFCVNETISCHDLGCKMVCLQTKHPNLGKFWRFLQWKMLVYFMAIWSILWLFGISYDHLVHFMVIWYFFSVLVSCNKKNLATLVMIISGKPIQLSVQN
jgi:hypothetical protein